MLQTALPLIAAGAGCALLPDAFERLQLANFAKHTGAHHRDEVQIFRVTVREE